MANADEVVVTTLVRAPVESAFAAFTDGIDRWWKRLPDDPTDAVVRFENDRLVSVSGAGADVLAAVDAWDPPHRIGLRWAGPHAQEGDTVAIAFEPDPAGTRVTVTHRRPGLTPQSAASAVIGFWWGELLRRLARAQ